MEIWSFIPSIKLFGINLKVEKVFFAISFKSQLAVACVNNDQRVSMKHTKNI